MKRLIALALLLLVLLALAVLWTQRKPIAADLSTASSPAATSGRPTRSSRIGFRTQRLENLVIGDPRAPDLTARWVEVRLSWAPAALRG